MVCTRTLVHSQPIIKCTIINIKWCVKLCFSMWTTSIFNQSAVFPSHAQFQYNFQLLLPASVYSPQENIYFPQPFLVGRILNIFIFKSLKENCIISYRYSLHFFIGERIEVNNLINKVDSTNRCEDLNEVMSLNYV